MRDRRRVSGPANSAILRGKSSNMHTQSTSEQKIDAPGVPSDEQTCSVFGLYMEVDDKKFPIDKVGERVSTFV